LAALVALTGFMGSGKSSVGRSTAALLGWSFVDMDDLFVQSEGITIPEFFASSGEAEFRARETRLLQRLLSDGSSGEGMVVALGGGTLETETAVELLKARGGVVLLDVDPDTAWARAAGTGRPLAVDHDRFQKLFARRRALYEDAADWVVPVEGRGVDELAQEVATIVQACGERFPRMWGRRLAATQRSSLIMGGPGALEVLQTHGSMARERGSRIYLMTDENVAGAWGERVTELLGASWDEHLLIVPAGETSKSVSTLAQCWDWLVEQGARRHDIVVALGGGVIGDLAGFAAATYQRGVTLWQVPTTLLAQVDSSVGGKTAVDLAAGKNLVGCFYQPDLVLTDPTTLTTLGHSDYVAGLGEVVKHALLLPPSFLERLEHEAANVLARDPTSVSWVVKFSVGFKAGVVEKDEREQGKRAILNLGHTVGHALEVVLGYGRVTHGQAVSLGLLVALRLSEQLLGLDPSVRERTRALLAGLGLPTTLVLPPTDLLLAAAGRDKKVRAGSSGFVGLRAIGDPVWGVDVTGEQLVQALEVIAG
jgi:shikimate kinase/3-dehydroquinate synthase